MSKVSEMTRDKWIQNTFPEWGTWLVEDIENEVVAPGNVAMWWLGCTGVWFKTPGGANVSIDLGCGNGKRTHGNGKMAVGHQMANMCGGRAMQPNLRNVPFVFDPFAFKQVDAVLATHYHQDHMSAEWAAHVLHSGMTTTDDKGNVIPVPFIGPKKSVETWVKWGVPEDRCVTVKPGDVIKIKDLEIVALDSFDRTCIVTTDSTVWRRTCAARWSCPSTGMCGPTSRPTARRSSCCTTSRRTATSTSSIPSSGRWAASTPIPLIRISGTSIIAAVSRIASSILRTSPSAPACNRAA